MKILLIICIPIFLGSCSLFSPVPDDPVRHLLEAAVSPRTANSSSPAVAIARPSIPPYLERSELVTRSGAGTLEIHEKDLWSEPLDSGISRVLADNLRRLTRSTNIQPSGNFITQDYSVLVEVRIERFDPLPDGSLVLECTWKAQPVRGGDAAPRSFRTTVPVVASSGEGINTGKRGRIVAMNEALARLSRAISKAL
jgi:hypothetical protein